MADDTLVNRYQQYKAGTAKLVNWLANTAGHCGDIANILSSLGDNHEQPTSGRKTSVTTPHVLPSLGDNHEQPASGHKTYVTTPQLLKLARVIRDAQVAVPDDVLRTLRAVICGREVCANWYSSFTSPIDFKVKQQNNSHRYFISVLKDIETILGASRPEEHASRSPSDATSSTQQVSTTEEENLSNIFSYLEVEDPQESPLDSVPSTRPLRKTNNFELEENEDSLYFAAWCFFKDLNDLRAQVRNVWQDYKAGKLTFRTAATITSFSMILLSDPARELAEEYPMLTTCDLIYQHIGLGVIVVGDEVILYPSESGQQDVPPHGPNQINGNPDLLCPRAWVILCTFGKLMRNRANRGEDPSKVVEYPHFDVHPFGRRLRKVLSEIKSFEELNGVAIDQFWTDDIFLESLHRIAQNPDRPPPLWSLAACQLSMDVYDIVGSTPEVEMDQYHRLHAHGIQSISKLLQYFGSEKRSGNKSQFVDQLRNELGILKRMALDPYRKPATEVPGCRSNYISSFRVHRLLPVYTGLLTSACSIITHRIGISRGRDGFAVISAAHLYRSALLAGVLTRPWPDMEMVIKSQSNKQSFVLESAKGITSMPQCFGVALGMKLSAFSKAKRPPVPGLGYIKKHGRNLEGWTLLTKSKSDQCRQAMTTVLNKSSILPEQYSLSNHREFLRNGGRSILNSQFIGACLEGLGRLADNRNDKVQTLLDQYEKTGKLSPAQLLIGAREVLAADGEILDFDYIEFDASCHDILKQIYSTCGPPLYSLVTKIQQQNNHFLYEIVYAILWNAAEKSRKGSIQTASFIAKASKALDNLIQRQGDTCSTRNVYKTVTFGPELPPNWNGEDEQHRTLRTFIGFSATASKSTGMYCASETNAKACADLYDFYMRWKRGDQTVSAEWLWDAVVKVLEAKIDRRMAGGQQESREMSNEERHEMKDVVEKLSLYEHIPDMVEYMFPRFSVEEAARRDKKSKRKGVEKGIEVKSMSKKL